ncbi:enolase C-terminal domain-like protein [Blattabacterium cuenoti]|uniref:enolase C-terminal domain-like protein n=1 Tax=Blattabacterium cuenoti TaxID=1653831 RepID=UPI00163CD081|nr:enolase C-terminal domain-like protein [Blattabacterium cuenoti]
MKSFLKKKIFFFKKNIINSKIIFNKCVIWFLIIKVKHKISIGECNPIIEENNLEKYEQELVLLSKRINLIQKQEICYYYNYIHYSSIFFGLEQVLLGLTTKFPIFYKSKFTIGEEGIPINYVIWLSKDVNYLINQIKIKYDLGFLSFKIKINLEYFENQYKALKQINHIYPTIKVIIDANECFNNYKIALFYIKKLESINIIHSIEQPIKSNNWNDMAKICHNSKIPITLDEELFSVNEITKKKNLLDIINPKYIVLRPNLNWGFNGVKEWILEAEKRNINWKISSSLETTIGMNVISQWLYYIFLNKQNIKYSYYNSSYSTIHHGLIIKHFVNDILLPLKMKNGYLFCKYDKTTWNITNLI